MIAQISLYIFLLATPLLGAPPRIPASSTTNSPDVAPPARSRPIGIKCFTAGVQPPNPGDCYLAMNAVACGNNTIDNGRVQYTSLRGIHNTVLLPLRWARPNCIVIVDLVSTASLPAGVQPDEGAEVETASLLEIATAAQQITEHCVTGGSRLGGKTRVGDHDLLSVYVANHPNKQPAPIAVVPAGNSEYPTLTDLAMGVCELVQ